MAQVLVTESYLSGIASAIRYKNGQSVTYKPSQMESAIRAIASAGDLSIISKTIISNGSYSPSGDGADAFSDVIVDVPNSYSAADEGKVVASGALSSQGVLSVNTNSIYDTTLISQVDVNVAGSSIVLISKSINSNGTYNPADDNADAYSQVVVSVPSGGGGGRYEDAFFVADFTKGLGFIATTYSQYYSQYAVEMTESGAYFATSNKAIALMANNVGDLTLYVDVASMILSSGTHRRFIMGTNDNGLIYRSTGVWAFYTQGAWQNTENTDGSYFDKCTVKLYIDASYYWHIYKDGSLFFEPSSSCSNIGFRIGATANGIPDALITGYRLYSGDYTEVP